MYTDSSNLKIYCDSSGLIRNHDIKLLTSRFQRRLYNNSQISFNHKLRSYLSHNREQELRYQSLLRHLLHHRYLDYIITMDCTFHEPENLRIVNLFGSIPQSSADTADIAENLCLFGEDIPSDIYLKCYHLLRSCDELLVDNSFLSLQIGQFLLQKYNGSRMILISSLAETSENIKLPTLLLTKLLRKYYGL